MCTGRGRVVAADARLQPRPQHLPQHSHIGSEDQDSFHFWPFFTHPWYVRVCVGSRKSQNLFIKKWSEMVRKLVTFFDTFGREGRAGGVTKIGPKILARIWVHKFRQSMQRPNEQ